MRTKAVMAVVAVWVLGCAGPKDGKTNHGTPGRKRAAVRASREVTNGSVTARPARSEGRVASREVKKMNVTSSAFAEGKPIPKKYAYRGEGANVSPPLSWSGAPEGTKSFALLVEDPDAPSPRNPRPKPWVHWVLYDIPAGVTSLAEGQSSGTQGKNDFGEPAYGGPMPPPGSGTHRYFFKVYALDKELKLPAGATRDQVLAAMQGHILAQGELYGTYAR